MFAIKSKFNAIIYVAKYDCLDKRYKEIQTNLPQKENQAVKICKLNRLYQGKM